VDFLGEIDPVALIIAAMCHDIGHTGVTNEFLIDTSHELALRYNDASPLENMHAAKLFEIGWANNDGGGAFFQEFGIKKYQHIRHVCIEAILHTDILAKYSESRRAMEKWINQNHSLFEHQLGPQQALDGYLNGSRSSERMPKVTPDRSSRSSENSSRSSLDGASAWPSPELQKALQGAGARALFRNALMQFSDASYPTKTWTICQLWADQITEEFFLLGDQQKALALPVPALYDREKTVEAAGQINYIEYIVLPLISPTTLVFAPLEFTKEQVLENADKWVEEWLTEQPQLSEDDKDRMLERVNKFDQENIMTRMLEQRRHSGLKVANNRETLKRKSLHPTNFPMPGIKGKHDRSSGMFRGSVPAMETGVVKNRLHPRRSGNG
jgi:hypothetical protein